MTIKRPDHYEHDVVVRGTAAHELSHQEAIDFIYELDAYQTNQLAQGDRKQALEALKRITETLVCYMEDNGDGDLYTDDDFKTIRAALQSKKIDINSVNQELEKAGINVKGIIKSLRDNSELSFNKIDLVLISYYQNNINKFNGSLEVTCEQPKPSVDVPPQVNENWSDFMIPLWEEYCNWRKEKGYRLSSSCSDLNDIWHFLASQGHLNQGWRDIESAPRDEYILILDKDREIWLCCYYPDNKTEKFRGTNSESFDNNIPTHWMPLSPLPTPPNED